MDDKYLHLKLIDEGHYSWLEYTIVECLNEFMLFKNVKFPSGISSITDWLSLMELDEILEELWKQKQSKEAHSDSSL